MKRPPFKRPTRPVMSSLGWQKENHMKKLIQNLLSIPFIPVMLLGLLWALTREAWEMGADCCGLLSDWFNGK